MDAEDGRVLISDTVYIHGLVEAAARQRPRRHELVVQAAEQIADPNEGTPTARAYADYGLS